MKKIFVVFIAVLLVNASIFQAHAYKLKLECEKSETNNSVPKGFPSTLISHIGEYLTINESLEITFASQKQDACDFDLEECVRTLLGTAHYRIIYHDTVLTWNNAQKKFCLISKDDKISPLKLQIQWFTCFKWLLNSKSMNNAHTPEIRLAME